jgi:hypothetical protein
LPRAEAAFKAINKAGDGRLAWAELLADSGARFIAADTDKDGKLSLDALVVATVPPSKRRAPPPAASARINEMIAGSCAALTRSISAASSFFTLPIAGPIVCAAMSSAGQGRRNPCSPSAIAGTSPSQAG